MSVLDASALVELARRTCIPDRGLLLLLCGTATRVLALPAPPPPTQRGWTPCADGFTGDRLAIVWVGYDEKKRIGQGMTGAHAALPIWTEFMMGATRGKTVEYFPLPSGNVARTVCVESGMLATDQCPSTTSEMFEEGTAPTAYCTTHPGKPLDPDAHTFDRPDSLNHDEPTPPGKEEIHI